MKKDKQQLDEEQEESRKVKIDQSEQNKRVVGDEKRWTEKEDE